MKLKKGKKLKERNEIERYEIEGRYEIERYNQVLRGR